MPRVFRLNVEPGWHRLNRKVSLMFVFKLIRHDCFLSVLGVKLLASPLQRIVRTSARAPSATATKIFSFDVSRPMKTSLCCSMARPRLSLGLGSGPSGATLDLSLTQGRATFTARTYGLKDRRYLMRLSVKACRSVMDEVSVRIKWLGLLPCMVANSFDLFSCRTAASCSRRRNDPCVLLRRQLAQRGLLLGPATAFNSIAG